MPTFKGNRGNLLQHWVLVELLEFLRSVNDEKKLCFVDAHAMSPYSERDANLGQTAPDFDRVLQALPGQRSCYELAWHELTKVDGVRYPSGAAFVHFLWKDAHLLLCEIDAWTVREIRRWFDRLAPPGAGEVHCGDWRARFSDGLPRDHDLYLVSFDPYMIDRHGLPAAPNPGNMYLVDMVRACAALSDLAVCGPVLVQVSTYSANNNNSQAEVAAAVKPIFAACGFRLDALVRADGNMMSMVFSRSVVDSSALGQLPSRFERWLEVAARA